MGVGVAGATGTIATFSQQAQMFMPDPQTYEAQAIGDLVAFLRQCTEDVRREHKTIRVFLDANFAFNEGSVECFKPIGLSKYAFRTPQVKTEGGKVVSIHDCYSEEWDAKKKEWKRLPGGRGKTCSFRQILMDAMPMDLKTALLTLQKENNYPIVVHIIGYPADAYDIDKIEFNNPMSWRTYIATVLGDLSTASQQTLGALGGAAD